MRNTLAVLAVVVISACSGGGTGGGSGGAGGSMMTIGAAGGTLTAAAGSSITVPSGALAADTSIAITQSPIGAPALPSQIVSRGDVFAFTPHGQMFSKPVTIQVPFTGSADAGVALFTADPGGAWTQVTSTQVVGNALKADVTHFSFFTAGQGGQWTTVFSDDFQRADGGPGANYTAQIYPTAGSILLSNGRVEISAAPGAQTYSKLLYNTAVPSTPTRVSAVFNNVTAEKGDFALTARISASGTDEVAYSAGVLMSTNTLAISKMTVDSAGMLKSNPTLGSAPFTAAANTAYTLVFTVNGGKLDFAVSTGTGAPTTVSATDAAPIPAGGKVSVNGNHTSASKLTIDDLKVEKYE